jgi:rubrerythrin
MDKKKTNIKLIKEMEVEILEEDLNEDDRFVAESIYECCNCHWRFTGGYERYGYGGFTSESTDLPNYCPMCGLEIEDYFKE